MKSIFKYQISYSAPTEIQLPMDSKVISADLDPHGDLCIWALVDPENTMIPRVFMVVGTGWSMEDEIDNWEFIGTVRQGPYMWHVFEVE